MHRETRKQRDIGAAMLAVVLTAAAGCGGGPPASGESACWTLAKVPGPEDLVVDPGPPRRLLVSSQDRRADPRPGGAVWSVPLDPGKSPYRLHLADRRDGCSFHPHGLDLVENEEGRFLYVINHHEAADRSPERGCLDAAGTSPAAGAEVTSVEVFKVEATRLRFLQRLADPGVLTHANDLVALPGGDLWVTNPPAGALASLVDGLRGTRSRIVHFDCASRGQDGRCTGRWRAATLEKGGGSPKIRFANGLAYRRGPPDRLYVAAGAGRRLHVFEVAGASRLRPKGEIPLAANPDNLTWIDGDRTAFLVAGHPDLRRLFQHAGAADTPSPSKVEEIRVESLTSETLFDDAGGRISAASVAACVDGDLVLGQVYEAAVLRCRMTVGCGREVSR